MNPKQFLLIGGVVLVLLGVFGLAGVIGPTAAQSVFGASWWFDGVESWTYLVLGVVMIVLAYALGADAQRPAVLILGVVAVLAGLCALLGYSKLLGANLENPADSLLLIILGAWALLASWKKESAPVLSGM